MTKFTELGAAMGPDDDVLRRLVEWSRPVDGVRSPMSLRRLALAAGVGEAKVAIAMKYAVKEGFAERVGDRDLQHAWVATAKADAWAATPQEAEAELPPPFMEPKGSG